MDSSQMQPGGTINIESAEEVNEIYLLYKSGSIKVKMSSDGHIK